MLGNHAVGIKGNTESARTVSLVQSLCFSFCLFVFHTCTAMKLNNLNEKEKSGITLKNKNEKTACVFITLYINISLYETNSDKERERKSFIQTE